MPNVPMVLAWLNIIYPMIDGKKSVWRIVAVWRAFGVIRVNRQRLRQHLSSQKILAVESL